ncbi:putative lipoprotein [Fusobacterium necrophorum subsp. funduliforme ATCC 51357]|uniref:Lipoprotein n=1 Tax=Fusobacterium gonidiaformans 3-1-5R TaxID=469605 RepID=E5BI25_9FUSO|nr:MULTISPECIES: hypothetical protein [Fusobacterium]EFS22148.1 hypothetical protein FSBG_01645 [Fusobacterium gonidiaformans 3-1-5R]EFS22931.1 hypothetical protein FSEG_00538 [Fusobacterium necrophorum D12]EIJ72423.1 putative lipoprotein [Fusobacterium necrophorum subsp. funduliforme ATCC 51357]KAB0552940.1 hypothetical protein F7P76_06140 [Fusobacterium necrophorum subsp. funduliforme]
MKKIMTIIIGLSLFISCGKKEPEYPIFTYDEKEAMYKEAKDNNNTEKLKEIEDLMKQLEIAGKKGDKVAEQEYEDWHVVEVLYVSPKKKDPGANLLNRSW